MSQFQPAYTFRYIVFCVPAAALLIGTGLAAAGRVTTAAGLALIILLALPAQLGERGPAGHADNIRRLDQIVARYERPGDAVLYPQGPGRGRSRPPTPTASPGFVTSCWASRPRDRTPLPGPTPRRRSYAAGSPVSAGSGSSRTTWRRPGCPPSSGDCRSGWSATGKSASPGWACMSPGLISARARAPPLRHATPPAGRAVAP